MAKKEPPKENSEKRAAILKELESVRNLLNEDIGDDEPVSTQPVKPAKQEAAAPQEYQEEFQIPLLDPARPGTYELDFSKMAPPPPPEEPTVREIDFSKKEPPAPAPVSKQVAPPPPPPPPPKKEISPEDIPTVDDITASSLFDDEEDDEDLEESRAAERVVTQAEIRDHAQLIIQGLLNDAISEMEEKLDEWIPKLEIRLQKRLEKAIDKYIEDYLKK